MKAGQKVVCIDDAAPWRLRNHFTTWLKKGRIYVMRGYSAARFRLIPDRPLSATRHEEVHA